MISTKIKHVKNSYDKGKTRNYKIFLQKEHPFAKTKNIRNDVIESSVNSKLKQTVSKEFSCFRLTLLATEVKQLLVFFFVVVKNLNIFISKELIYQLFVNHQLK